MQEARAHQTMPRQRWREAGEDKAQAGPSLAPHPQSAELLAGLQNRDWPDPAADTVRGHGLQKARVPNRCKRCHWRRLQLQMMLTALGRQLMCQMPTRGVHARPAFRPMLWPTSAHYHPRAPRGASGPVSAPAPWPKPTGLPANSSANGASHPSSRPAQPGLGGCDTEGLAWKTRKAACQLTSPGCW